jgi:hypothetical protein
MLSISSKHTGRRESTSGIYNWTHCCVWIDRAALKFNQDSKVFPVFIYRTITAMLLLYFIQQNVTPGGFAMVKFGLSPKTVAEVTQSRLMMAEKRTEVLAALKATQNRDAELARIGPVPHPVRALDLVGHPSPLLTAKAA